MQTPVNERPGHRRVSPERLLEFVSEVYRSAGVVAADAHVAADAMVQADLWGHQSHGTLRLGWYYARLRSGAMTHDRRDRRTAAQGRAHAKIALEDRS